MGFFNYNFFSQTSLSRSFLINLPNLFFLELETQFNLHLFQKKEQLNHS